MHLRGSPLIVQLFVRGERILEVIDATLSVGDNRPLSITEAFLKARPAERIDPRVAPERGDLVDIAYETGALHFFDLETGGALR